MPGIASAVGFAGAVSDGISMPGIAPVLRFTGAASGGIAMPGISPAAGFASPEGMAMFPIASPDMPMSAIVRSGRTRRAGIGARVPARTASVPAA